MNQNPSPQSQRQAVEAAEKNRGIRKPLVISVWVVPIIVCVGVLFASLIAAALMLGNK